MAFSHIGLYVGDMSRMVSFYTDVLGFSVTDQACIREADVVFLSRNPDEHHQIVLVPGRAPGSPSTVNQISFRVIAFSELRRLHSQLLALKVPALNPTNHGGSSYFPQVAERICAQFPDDREAQRGCGV